MKVKDKPRAFSKNMNLFTKSLNHLPALYDSPRLNSTVTLPKIKALQMSPKVRSEGESIEIPEIENTAASKKHCGSVLRYAVNTHPGLKRVTNEDRVSIIINIPCPAGCNVDKWPRSSFYAIYDGHGGKMCANYLKESLHKFIFEHENFPSRPKDALLQGFLRAEQEFLILAEAKNDRSGSCALVVLIIGDKCYTANTGDSRAILSVNKGEKVVPLTVDHKPNDPNERDRIIQAGGQIVTHIYPVINSKGIRIGENVSRVEPGSLAISRSIGDIDIKVYKTVIPDPDVRSFRLKAEYDFIVMASDGIYDKLCDREVADSAWNAIKKYRNVHEKVVGTVEDIMKASFLKKTEDNVTVIFLALKGIKADLNEKSYGIV